MKRIALGAAITLVLVACGGGPPKLGPLTIEPPEGWLVTDREADSIKITNGTIADENSTTPGTATAVFDVYVESTQTLTDFRKVLKKNNVKADEEHLTVDGYDAVVVSYPDSFFGPRSDVLFVPEWDVRVVYRAAFPDNPSAFVRNRDAFREAVASIRFSGRPRDRA